MQKHTNYETYAKTDKHLQYTQKHIQHLRYMQNIPNMQNKHQNTKICNKYTNYAKSYHGATGSDTTSVASRMSFDTWLLVLGVRLSCVLCMWTFTSFTLCVSILNIQYMQ